MTHRFCRAISSALRRAFIARTIAICATLTIVSLCRAGGVQKIDDTTVTGDIVSFDGKTVTVQSRDGQYQPLLLPIDVRDLIQVSLAAGAPAPTTAPATKPAAPDEDAATPEESSSALRRLLRLVGVKGRGNDAAKPAPATTQSATTQPAGSRAWQIKLTNGDLLRGQLRGWSDQRITFDHPATGAALTIPAQQIAEIWQASPQLVRKARALKVEATGNDIAFVSKDDDVVAVSGVALGIDRESLSFRHDNQDRKINLSRVVGLVLVSQKAADAATSDAGGANSFHQAFHFSSGDVLSAHWKSLADGAVELNTFWDQSIKFPAAKLSAIDFRNGRVVYLSDLKPSRVEQTPYFDRVVPWCIDTALGGGPIVLSDGQYQRGISVHSRCVLEYDLHAAFDKLKTKFGFEQPAGAMGRASIRVIADGKPLYENADARGDQKPQDLDLDVHGIAKLILEVDFGKDQDVGDRVVWANARLVRQDVGK